MLNSTISTQDSGGDLKMGSVDVVLIDDEESMREGCRQTLEEEGLSTATACDGSEGLRLIEKIRPNVVVVDLKMPGISGIEVLEKIPEIDPSIVPIVLTGFGTIDSAVDSMKIGAFDFLTKPVEPDKLVETVRRGMELNQIRSEQDSSLKEPAQVMIQDETLNKQDALLKGLTAIGNGYSVGFERSEFMGELKQLEAEAKFHARSLGDVKERERSILSIVNQLRLVDEIIQKHEFKKSALIQILLETQNKLNWLPGYVLKWISERLDVSLSQIYTVASFYDALSLEPQGEHTVKVCTGTACHVRGAPDLMKKVSSILEIEEDETDDKQMFTLKTVNCLGCCALAPVLQLDDSFVSNPSIPKLKKTFHALEEKEIS